MLLVANRLFTRYIVLQRSFGSIYGSNFIFLFCWVIVQSWLWFIWEVVGYYKISSKIIARGLCMEIYKQTNPATPHSSFPRCTASAGTLLLGSWYCGNIIHVEIATNRVWDLRMLLMFSMWDYSTWICWLHYRLTNHLDFYYVVWYIHIFLNLAKIVSQNLFYTLASECGGAAVIVFVICTINLHQTCSLIVQSITILLSYYPCVSRTWVTVWRTTSRWEA